MSLGCLRLRFLDLNDPYYGFSDEDFADSFMDEVNEGNSIGRWGLGVSREAFSSLQVTGTRSYDRPENRRSISPRQTRR